MIASRHIRIIAQSSQVRREPFLAGVGRLEAWGFTPRYDPEMLQRQERYCAGSVEQRTAELRAALAEPETGAVWAARGGFGAIQLLDRIDRERVRGSGKLLIGFSDVTALHLLWHQAGVRSLHGPNITSLDRMDTGSADHLRRLLTGDEPPAELTGRGGRGEPTEGWLIGGNLAVLASMSGSAWQPGLRGAILFLEDVDERPYRIDRMLTQLALAGWLEGLSGVILGDFVGCDPTEHDGAGYEGHEVAVDFFAARGIPVAWGFPFGHGRRMHPLCYGARVGLEPERGVIRYIE